MASRFGHATRHPRPSSSGNSASFSSSSTTNSTHHKPSSNSTSETSSMKNKASFWKREWNLCRTTVWSAGSKYNILVSSLIGFVACAAILLLFQPVFVMKKRELEEPAQTEYLDHVNASSISSYTISVGALFLWSSAAAAAICLLTYFTNRASKSKPSSSFVRPTFHPST